MAIIGLQRRIREVGRIRIGVQAETRSGRKAPRKLDRFRLTSPDRAVMEAVVERYGGAVGQWNNGQGTQWEAITDTNELRIALPPNPTDMAWSQFYEQWGKGFCSHRCDGQWNTIVDRACSCDPDDRLCKPTSRLSVLLPDIAGLGLWRLESHGYYAAVELAGAVDLIQQMAGAHAVIPARLRLEHREVRRLIDGKPEVRKFAVPVIDLDVSILGVRAIAVKVGDAEVSAGDVPELPAGFEPVPAVEPPAVLSVVEQVKEAEKPRPVKKRANAAAPLPATGRTPRKAADVDPNVCVVCGQAYGALPLVKNTTGTGGRYIHKKCSETSPVGEEPAPPPAGSGDGPPDDVESTPPVEPVPATARPLSLAQQGKVFAIANRLWPKDVVDDDTQRAHVLGLCEALGTPGLVSRGDIDADTANVLIDALEAIEAGQCEWTDGRLVDVESGQVLGFREAKP